MILTSAFTKTYGSFRLDIPELSLAPGTVTAVIGPNGCGKSTLGRCLAGILLTDTGKPLLCRNRAANPVTERSDLSGPSREQACIIGYAPQNPYPFRMSLRKNILLGCGDPAKCEALMEALNLGAFAAQNAKKLSGGQTARMALARILAGSYDLLILDEPTASMDLRSTRLAETCIRRYAQETGSVLLITHSLAQAGRLADRILFLDEGKLVESGTPEELLNHPKEEKTKRFLNFSMTEPRFTEMLHD